MYEKTTNNNNNNNNDDDDYDDYLLGSKAAESIFLSLGL
jgi:hypothetical protein